MESEEVKRDLRELSGLAIRKALYYSGQPTATGAAQRKTSVRVPVM
jgi:hypothetical protein